SGPSQELVHELALSWVSIRFLCGCICDLSASTADAEFFAKSARAVAQRDRTVGFDWKYRQHSSQSFAGSVGSALRLCAWPGGRCRLFIYSLARHWLYMVRACLLFARRLSRSAWSRRRAGSPVRA